MSARWSVSVETKSDDPGGLDPDRFYDVVDVLTRTLSHYSASVGGDEHGYTARISIEAPDAAAAVAEATVVLRAAAEVAGFPSWPVVRSEAVREDVLDDKGSPESSLPELAGTSEITSLLGVSRQRLSEIRKNASLGFPRPIVDLAAGPVWLRAAVDVWLEGWERKPGRPRASRQVDAEPPDASELARGVGAEAASSVAEPEQHHGPERTPAPLKRAAERQHRRGVELLPPHLL